MLTKRKLPKGNIRVMFAMPALEGVTTLYLVGDFNNWSVNEHPMKQAADGSWSLGMSIPAGHKYQYRYFANNATWHNDWQADAYAPNEHGTDNSVLDLTVAGLPTAKPKKAPAAKKPAAPRKKKTE
ncbi:MAG: isoamylase early set domain-containing protein [Anaerolineales bacterium]